MRVTKQSIWLDRHVRLRRTPNFALRATMGRRDDKGGLRFSFKLAAVITLSSTGRPISSRRNIARRSVPWPAITKRATAPFVLRGLFGLGIYRTRVPLSGGWRFNCRF